MRASIPASLRALGLSLLVGGVAVACGSNSAVNPLPQQDAGPEASISSKPPDTPGTPPKPAAVKRTVIQRNPYGDVAASDNLLWDGDFEWQTAFGDEYGWVDSLLFAGVGTFPEIRIGAECHSGMKCGYIEAGGKASAIGVSPSGATVSASAWVKPPSDSCSDVSVQLFSCSGAGEPDVPLTDADGKTDADGWCHFRAVAPERKSATCIVFDAKFGGGKEALIDDAVIQAAPVGAQALIAFGPPAPGDVAAVRQMQKILRQYLKPTTRPPSAALQAYRAWRAGR
jgi:hypothetical protein